MINTVEQLQSIKYEMNKRDTLLIQTYLHDIMGYKKAVLLSVWENAGKSLSGVFSIERKHNLNKTVYNICYWTCYGCIKSGAAVVRSMQSTCNHPSSCCLCAAVRITNRFVPK